MRLIDAYNLLVEDGVADNHRYFAEVYKQFQFQDEDVLKDYIDFILHEPVHWMRCFPAKLTSKTAFSKPKTAVIKLLKKTAVMEDLGVDLATEAHSVIWETYKIHCEEILKERGGASAVSVAEQAAPSMSVTDEDEELSEIESYESIPVPPMPPRTKVIRITETQTPVPPATQTSVPATQTNDAERVVFLKNLLFQLAETLPAGVSDAFRMLVERV